MKATCVCFLIVVLLFGSAGGRWQASAQSKDLRVNLSEMSDEELQAFYAQILEQFATYTNIIRDKLGEMMGVTITPDLAGYRKLNSLYPELTKILVETTTNMMAAGSLNKCMVDVGVGIEGEVPIDPKQPQCLLTSLLLIPDQIIENEIRNALSRAMPWLGDAEHEEELEFLVNEFSDRMKAQEAANAAVNGDYETAIRKAMMLVNEANCESRERARQRAAGQRLSRRIIPFRPSPNPRIGGGAGGGGRGNGGTIVTTSGECLLPVFDPRTGMVIGYVRVPC